jgi:Tfp pilus assembly protein FimT
MRVAKSQGFSLIEMVIFIVVMGIIGSSGFLIYSQVLVHAGRPAQLLIASQRAQARLELILGQRRMLGYSSFADPCNSGSTNPVCAVSTRNLPVTLPITDNSNEKLLQATGIGSDGSSVTLTTLVGRY